MDTNKPAQQDQNVENVHSVGRVNPIPSDMTRTGEHVDPLAGLIEAVPDTIHKYADQPTEEVMPTPVGQLVPVQVVSSPQVAVSTRPQRLAFIRTLLNSPKSRIG